MGIFAIIFWLIFSILPISVGSNLSSSQANGRDTVRKNDIITNMVTTQQKKN